MCQLTITFADRPDPTKWRAGIKLLAKIAMEILAEHDAADLAGANTQLDKDKTEDGCEHGGPSQKGNGK